MHLMIACLDHLYALVEIQVLAQKKQNKILPKTYLNINQFSVHKDKIDHCKGSFQCEGIYPAIMREKNRITLDVSVNDPLRVKHRERLQNRQTHGGNLLFIHPENTILKANVY